MLNLIQPSKISEKVLCYMVLIYVMGIYRHQIKGLGPLMSALPYLWPVNSRTPPHTSEPPLLWWRRGGAP